MKLSELCGTSSSTRLIRDGEFDDLGLITHKANRKSLSFIDDEKYIKDLTSDISCIICSQELISRLPDNIGIACAQMPRVEYFKFHNYLCSSEGYARKKFASVIGNNCSISSRSIIDNENVIIGDNVIIEDNVVIKKNVTIGNNCVIRSGSILGGEGFEFKRVKGESILPVTHAGGVLLENNVEIQQNCCIDKAVYPWDNTVIGEYTKIDNFVQIAHACRIGKRCLIAAKSNVGGVTVIGNDCWVGLSATISNCLKIGNNCRVSLGSVVTKSLEDNQVVSGNFAVEHSKFISFIKKLSSSNI